MRLVRTQLTKRAGDDRRQASPNSRRRWTILKWIYLGKSLRDRAILKTSVRCRRRNLHVSDLPS